MCKEVSILLDDGSDLLPELRKAKLNLIVVPKSYRPDLIGKGRAMNYAIETHVGNDGWVCWLDDDNLLLDDKFLYEIPYYGARGYVAMSPLITPRRGRSTMTYVMDWIRVFDCNTLYKFFTGLLRTPVLGLYGELLTVRWSTLKEIGYNNRTITEDFRFSRKSPRCDGFSAWKSRSRDAVSIRESFQVFSINHSNQRRSAHWSVEFISGDNKCSRGYRLRSLCAYLENALQMQ